MVDFTWGRTLVAVVTPFTEQGEVNYSLAAEFCEHLVNKGCDGVVVAGTTGESPTLTAEEKLKLFAAVKDQIGDKGKVIAGVGCNVTSKTLALIKKSASIGVDGYMVVTPYYNKPNLSGLLGHFQAIDSVSQRPVMLYNVPSRTGLDIRLEEYEQIFATCPRITALKEASADMDKASALAECYSERVTLLSGNDNLVLPQMAVGFEGVVSVAGNVIPGLMAELVRSAIDNPARARTLHQKALPLFRALFAETNPVPVKAAVNMSGWLIGPPRLPLGAISPDSKSMLIKAMAECQDQ